MDFWIQLLENMGREVISPSTAAFVIAAIGLNIHFGYTGLLNMGQAGFMLVGAYGFAISLREGLPIWLAVICCLAAAALFAVLLGIPTLQLRGDYLAIVTISAAEIIRYVGRSTPLNDITGASYGIPGVTYRESFTSLSFLGDGQTTLGPYTLDNTGVDGWWVRLVAWSLVAVLAVMLYLLVRSPWGRVLRGIREDEDALRSLGKNVYAYKLQALVLGGVIGGLGGMVYILPSALQPDSMGRSLTFFVWTALLLGGAASIFGPIIGPMIFFAVRLLVTTVSGEYVPNSVMNSQQTEQFGWILVGIALMLLVIYRPQGILGNKKELRFNV